MADVLKYFFVGTKNPDKPGFLFLNGRIRSCIERQTERDLHLRFRRPDDQR